MKRLIWGDKSSLYKILKRDLPVDTLTNEETVLQQQRIPSYM